MEKYLANIHSKNIILALGAESAGNFAVFKNGDLHHSEDFGDLIEEANFQKYSHTLSEFLKKEKAKPDVILCDLHPLFKTTALAKQLAKKYRAHYVPVQHHVAHIFSALGDRKIHEPEYNFPTEIIGIALDGTGYGLDEKIWGGEIFIISHQSSVISQIKRIGQLENQVMIGGEKAIQEPARILLAIANKLKTEKQKLKAYEVLKKYYSKNDITVLENQLKLNFNCIETSSCGRILDAVSLLLGFCDNERKYKHEPIKLLEDSSTRPFEDIEMRIESNQILNTTYLFEYLLTNLYKDKKRLAATAQLYIAQGLYEILKAQKSTSATYLAGGIANNKIISGYLESQGVYTSKIIPRGDAGISVGQIIYQILANPRD